MSFNSEREGLNLGVDLWTLETIGEPASLDPDVWIAAIVTQRWSLQMFFLTLEVTQKALRMDKDSAHAVVEELSRQNILPNYRKSAQQIINVFSLRGLNPGALTALDIACSRLLRR